MHVFYCPNLFFFYITAAIFHLMLILLMEMYRSSCVTVTEGFCNNSSFLRSGHSTLLFLFKSFVAWNTFFDNFSIVFSVHISYLCCTIVTQGHCNAFSVSQSGPSFLIIFLSYCWRIFWITFPPFVFHLFSQWNCSVLLVLL